MKSIVTTLMTLMGHLFVHAQDERAGFRQMASWQEVTIAAKTEERPILIDFHATWCMPCKQMETSVYTDSAISTLLSGQYVAIKVQTDSTKADDQQIRLWYRDAAILVQKYQVNAYPTFLIISSDGKLLHRFSGGMDKQAFLDFLAGSLRPERQYYTLQQRLDKNDLSEKELRFLARLAQQNRDQDIFIRSSREYVGRYLATLPEKELLTKQNINYLQDFTDGSASPGFILWKRHGKAIDGIMNNPRYSRQWTLGFINRELINPFLKSAEARTTTPEWASLQHQITERFGKDFEQQAMLEGHMVWNLRRKQYDSAIYYFNVKTELFGYDTSGMAPAFFNNFIWDVHFEHGTNRRELLKAAKWMREIVDSRNDPIEIDTYANLLYKAGQRKQAIAWQEKAVQLENERAARSSYPPNSSLQDNLNKMRKNEPTWLQN
jgi:thioredoxin-related protein